MMSGGICRNDRRKLNQIFEQVEALSDVVDKLRMELINLKKVPLNANQEKNVSFEAFAQTEIVTYSLQKNGNEAFNYNHLSNRNVTKNVRTSPLVPMMSDKRSVICTDRCTGKLLKDRVKQAIWRNKTKKYKKCSCKGQCPYALYKLPCNKYRCNSPEKKMDNKISELTLECLSFGKENDFLTFINADAIQKRNDGVANFPSIQNRVDESSSTSSLSADLKANVSNHSSSESIDEFSKRRTARTYTINRTRKNVDFEQQKTGREKIIQVE